MKFVLIHFLSEDLRIIISYYDEISKNILIFFFGVIAKKIKYTSYLLNGFKVLYIQFIYIYQHVFLCLHN